MGRNLGPLNIKDSYEGLVQISGSNRDTLTDGSGSVITNLNVTSSFALTASYAENVVPAPTGSFMITGSIVDATSTFTKGDGSVFTLTVDNVANAVSSSHSVNSDTAISASYAVTASYAENASVGTLQEVTDAGSTTTTAITTAGINAGSLISRDGFTVTGSANQIRIIDNGDTTKNVNISWEENNNSLEFDSSGTITGATFVIDETTFTKTQLSNISASGYISASSFIGDGSNLTGISTTPFPYTGSAEITGSIDLVGNFTSNTSTITSTNTAGNNFVSGKGNTISGTAATSAILGGESNEITAGSQNIILGGSDKQITSTSSKNAIINGWGGAFDGIGGSVQHGTIVGSIVSNITGGGKTQAIFGGRGHSITSAGQKNTILGGLSSTLSSGNDNVIIGGENNQVSSGDRSVVIGGYGNNGQAGNGVILGGANNTTNTGQFIVVVGGSNNSITGTSENAVIVGGTGGSIASHNSSVIIGGTSLATSKADEVVVPSLDINGSVVQNVQALTITSNTSSLDASTGQMFTLTLQNATDTHLELSNQVAGQTFSLKITNNATAAGTITFDTQFEFEGGTAFTATAATNAVDILTFTTFDGSNVQCVGSTNFS